VEQYLILAHDGTDAGAKQRRMAVRPAHLENVRPLEARGMLLIGGALLDDAGEMVGSVCVVNVADRAELDAWLAADPYVTGAVWQRIEVKPMRVAVGLKP
jgi:uncharacterized protein YciI